MDTCMHKTMVSVASLEKIEIIKSQEFMPSEAKLKFLKKMIILGPKTAILGPQFCRILVLGPHFGWLGGPGPLGPPGSAPESYRTSSEYLKHNFKFIVHDPIVIYHNDIIDGIEDWISCVCIIKVMSS